MTTRPSPQSTDRPTIPNLEAISLAWNSLPPDETTTRRFDPHAPNHQITGTCWTPVCALGCGSRSIVYEATHRDSTFRAAVKVAHARGDGRQRGITERAGGEFLRRARHVHLVEVVESGITSDGRHYLAMERLEGETLRERVRRAGVLDIASALELGCQLLAALATLHSAGVVHGDVRPDNAFLTRQPTGRLHMKLIDLGSARNVEDPADCTAESWPRGDKDPRYEFLPPEARQTLVSSMPSDVYAAAITVYWAMAGRMPFEPEPEVIERPHGWDADSGAQTVEVSVLSILPEGRGRALRVAPSHHVRGMTSELERILLRAIASPPSERFRTAAELGAALGQELERLRGIPANVTKIDFAILPKAREDWQSEPPSAPGASKVADENRLRETRCERAIAKQEQARTPSAPRAVSSRADGSAATVPQMRAMRPGDSDARARTAWQDAPTGPAISPLDAPLCRPLGEASTVAEPCDPADLRWAGRAEEWETVTETELVKCGISPKPGPPPLPSWVKPMEEATTQRRAVPAKRHQGWTEATLWLAGVVAAASAFAMFGTWVMLRLAK